MKRFLCAKIPSQDHWSRLSGSEAHHAMHVLRLRIGESVIALDGKGASVLARLSSRGDGFFLEYAGEAPRGSVRDFILPVVLEVAVLKADAMEWVIEKAVELGVQSFVPVLTDHTVVQVAKKGPEEFRRRWQSIADQALKQCGRLTSMAIEPIVSVRELSGHRLWCDEQAQGQSPHLVTWLKKKHPDLIQVLIGPEGGWSDAERKLLLQTKGCQRVHLGPLVLRAETAAVFAMSLIAGECHYREELDKTFPGLD